MAAAGAALSRSKYEEDHACRHDDLRRRCACRSNTVAGFGTDLKKGANHVGTALESIGSKGQSSQAPAKSAESKPVEDK